MQVRDVMEWLEGFAPFATQEGFDNAGLLVGDPAAEITRVLFCLDVTPDVVAEAAAYGAELIVSHHPLMFGGIRRIRYDQPEGAMLTALIRAGLNLIAAHTNFDQASGGTGDSLAETLGLTSIVPCGPSLYLKQGVLPAETTAQAFLGELNRRLNAHARLYGNPQAAISRVAVGPGAIGDEYALAAENGAQAFVVGEIKHHELIAACAMGLTVYETGHYATELPGVTALTQRFLSDAASGHWPVEARLTTIAPYACSAE